MTKQDERQVEIDKIADIVDETGFPCHNREEAIEIATRLVDSGIGTKKVRAYEAECDHYWECPSKSMLKRLDIQKKSNCCNDNLNDNLK